MSLRRASALLITTGCALAGCSIHTTTNSRTIQSVRVHSFDEAANRAFHSPSYARLDSEGVQHMLLLDDGQTESFFYIMLGQDADDFVHRCGSLRVARDRGAVERLTYDDSGELFWVQD